MEGDPEVAQGDLTDDSHRLDTKSNICSMSRITGNFGQMR